MLRKILLCLAIFATAHLPAQTVQNRFRISGKAVNAVNGRPLAGIEVSISKAEQLDSALQKMLTAGDGTFAFAGLEPGKYVLSGQGNGFRRQGYEQHGMFLSAVVAGTAAGSENLVFRLRPDSRIVGTIIDDEGDPVPNAMVYLFRLDASMGFRKIYQAAVASSDDRGYYHLPHLESGRYYLLISAQPWFIRFLGAADTGNLSSGDKTLPDVAFPIAFYPGVTDSSSATPIVLSEGQEFKADFTLTAVPAVRVRVAHLNNSPEQPKNVTLSPEFFGTEINVGQRQVPVNDAYEVRGVAPGKYILGVQSYGTAPEKRSTLVSIASDMDIDADATLPTPSIGGVVQMDNGLPLQQQAYMLLWNSRTDETLESPIDEKGQFYCASDSLSPGNYFVFAISGLNSIISSLSTTGAKVTGQSVQLTGSGPVEMNVKLSTTLSTINGTVRRDGKPFAGAMVVLVPENPDINLPLFRRDQSDSDGTFTLHDVLPGRYKLLAADDGWDVEWATSTFLKPRLGGAETIEVQPNETYQTLVEVR